MSVSYDKVLPWELGKTVYVPEKDWLYRINSLNYSYTKGQSFTCSIGADYGHPARLLLPVPWTTLYDGTASDFDIYKAVRDPKVTAGLGSDPWVSSYIYGKESLNKPENKRGPLGDFVFTSLVAAEEEQAKALTINPLTSPRSK